MLKYLLYYDVDMRHEIRQLKKTFSRNVFNQKMCIQ